MKKIIFLLVMLFAFSANAEIYNLYDSMHRGACFYIVKSSRTAFSFCSVDHDLNPETPEVKFFKIVLVGNRKRSLDNSKVTFTNVLSMNSISLKFDGPEYDKEGIVYKSIYSVETPEVYLKFIRNQTPIFIDLSTEGTDYRFILSRMMLKEMAIVAEL